MKSMKRDKRKSKYCNHACVTASLFALVIIVPWYVAGEKKNNNIFKKIYVVKVSHTVYYIILYLQY
jgi:hypothetical protein